MAPGSVTLVGAGPGDPDLLTVKALRALQDADIVFHDEEISPEILDRIRRDAVRVAIGRRDRDIASQRIIDAAKAGRRVVRLKAGDAFGPGRRRGAFRARALPKPRSSNFKRLREAGE